MEAGESGILRHRPWEKILMQDRHPTLPIFQEADLPSAEQPGLLIGIVKTADGSLVVGVSREDGTWGELIPGNLS